MKSSLEYDPETGILRCDGCQQALNVKKYKPGRKVMCPSCQRVLVVPDAVKPDAGPADDAEPKKESKKKKKGREAAAAEGAGPGAAEEPIFDPDKKLLTCPGCQSQYKVAGYTPGRQILCVTCERLLTVPAMPAKSIRKERPRSEPAPEPEAKRLAAEEAPKEAVNEPPAGKEKECEPPGARTERRERTSRREKSTARGEAADGAPAIEDLPPAPEEKKSDRGTDRGGDRATKTGRHTTRRPKTETKASAEATLGGKRLLTCKKCASVYNVTSIDVGRKILCLRCETIMEVTIDLPIVSEAEMGGLNVIDLGGDGGGAKDDLSDAKRAFKQFYEREETRAIAREKARTDRTGQTSQTTRRHTDRTIRISAADLRDMVDKEQERPDLGEALAGAGASIRAKRAAKLETKRNPVRLLLGIGVPVGFLVVVAGFLVHRSILESERRAQEEAARQQLAELEKPTVGTDLLTPGNTVTVYGLVPGDCEIYVGGGQPIGTVLATRDQVRLWAVDETQSKAADFKRFLAQRTEFGGRVCLRVVGRVRPVAAGMKLPPGTDTGVYVSLSEAELIDFEAWQQKDPQIEILGQGEAPAKE